MMTASKDDQYLIVVNGRVRVYTVRRSPVGGDKFWIAGRAGEIPLQAALDWWRRLQSGQHDLNEVVLPIPADAEPGTGDLLTCVEAAAQRAGFQVRAKSEPVSTAKIIADWPRKSQPVLRLHQMRHGP